MKKLLLGIILIFFPLIASAQDEVLTNQSITDMLELGFSNDVIVTKINTSKNNFDTSIQALKELKEKLIRQLIFWKKDFLTLKKIILNLF